MNIIFLVYTLGIDERLGVMTLSSILKKKGHQVSLLNTERFDEAECLSIIKKNKADVLAYSIMTGEHTALLALNERIKKAYSCFSVFGGPHPTYSPQMIHNTGVDAVCRGEGDIFFPELLRKMVKGEDFYETPNFWFKKPDGTIVKNPMGPLVQDMDRLPFPDRAIVENASPPLRSKGKKMFMTMRGCPYKCSYCFNHAYNRLTRGKGKQVRYRSVDSVIEEIKTVKNNYFLNRVGFEDDTFLLKPPGWLAAFAKKYKEEIDLPMTCYVRPDLLDEQKVKLLKQMNCTMAFMGIDPPDPQITSDILQRHITTKQTIQACQLLKKYKIRVGTLSLLGLPVDNPLDTAFSLLDLNHRLRPYLALSYLLYPYPETDIRRIAIEKKMFHSDHEKMTPSNRIDTTLIYGNAATKGRLINLNTLFGILVQFRWLRRFAPFFIALPASKRYAQMFYIFYGMKMLRLAGGRILIQTAKSYIPFYFRYTKKAKNNLF